jgi:hypothetical protein
MNISLAMKEMKNIAHWVKQQSLTHQRLIDISSYLHINTWTRYLCILSSPCQRQCELLPSLGVCRLSSVNFSHFNLLLWNLSAKWTETW